MSSLQPRSDNSKLYMVELCAVSMELGEKSSGEVLYGGLLLSGEGSSTRISIAF